jgi:hypothetical protein
VDEVGIKISGDKKHLQKWKEKDGREKRNIDEIQNTPYINTQGRFPANLLVSDDMLNDGSITQGTKTKVLQEKNIGYEGWGLNKKKLVEKSDKGTNSRYYDIDRWFNNLIDV